MYNCKKVNVRICIIEKILVEENEENGYFRYRVPGVIATKNCAIIYYEGKHGLNNSVMDILYRIYQNEKLSDRKILASGEGNLI